MARVSTIVTNFRAGELSPRLEGRIDLDKYNEAAQTMQNMLVFPQGGQLEDLVVITLEHRRMAVKSGWSTLNIVMNRLMSLSLAIIISASSKTGNTHRITENDYGGNGSKSRCRYCWQSRLF